MHVNLYCIVRCIRKCPGCCGPRAHLNKSPYWSYRKINCGVFFCNVRIITRYRIPESQNYYSHPLWHHSFQHLAFNEDNIWGKEITMIPVYFTTIGISSFSPYIFCFLTGFLVSTKLFTGIIINININNTNKLRGVSCLVPVLSDRLGNHLYTPETQKYIRTVAKRRLLNHEPIRLFLYEYNYTG